MVAFYRFRIPKIIMSLSTPLPILQLPESHLERVLKYANLIDVFDFSLCSPKCAELVKKLLSDRSLFVEIDYPETLHVTFQWVTRQRAPEPTSAPVPGLRDTSNNYKWHFLPESQETRGLKLLRQRVREANQGNYWTSRYSSGRRAVKHPAPHFAIRTLDGFPIRMIGSPNTLTVYGGDREKSMCAVIRHLAKLFVCQTQLEIHPYADLTPLIDLPADFRRGVQRIEVNDGSSFEEDRASGRPMFASDFMARIIDNFPTEHLEINLAYVEVTPRIRFTRKLQYETLILLMDVRGRDLLKIDSEDVEICGVAISEKDLNAFLKRWLNGKTGRIREARIKEIAEETSWSMEQVLSGITQYRGEQKRYADELGIEIERNDGVRATIWPEDSFARMLQFTAHYPEDTGVESDE